jgi:Fuc2NAc and GlcNAc transferase
MTADVCVAVSALFVSLALTAVFRRLALRVGIVDTPNARSSHTQPTPIGGGVAVVLTFLAGLAILTARDRVPTELFIAMAGGGGALALVGFIDDFRGLAAGVRALVQFAAATWGLYWLGGMPAIQLGPFLVDQPWALNAFGAVGMVWIINLYNFMDGTDGLAGSEAVFVALCGGGLLLWSGHLHLASAALLLAAATGGFLYWNLPRARIFLGDVGSVFIGFVLCLFLVQGAIETDASIWPWLLLLGAFIVDATVTLVRRIWLGAKWHEAHRSHAYQRLARRWDSHGKLLAAAMAVNLLGLAPAAIAAWLLPQYGFWILLGAFCPLAWVVYRVGAGTQEAMHAPDEVLTGAEEAL